MLVVALLLSNLPLNAPSKKESKMVTMINYLSLTMEMCLQWRYIKDVGGDWTQNTISRPWWTLCRWCRSPWWRHASSGRPPWRTGHGFPWRRKGPGRLLPGRRPAAACWRARTPRRGWMSPLACRWSAPLPAWTHTWHHGDISFGCCDGKKGRRQRADRLMLTVMQLFLAVNGALVEAPAAARIPSIIWHGSRLSNRMMDERRETVHLWNRDASPQFLRGTALSV